MQVQRGPRGSINKQPPLAAQPPRGLLPLALTTALPKCGVTLMVGPVDLQLRNQGRGEAAPGSLCAVRAVDESVLLLRPESELSNSSVSGLLTWQEGVDREDRLAASG